MTGAATPALPVSPLLFGLPPSFTPQQSSRLRRHLEAALGQDVAVVTSQNYTTLFQQLRAGQAHAAWAPPFLCARLESQGQRVLMWGLRKGLATYRSALLARADSKLTLQTLQGSAAAWVDTESTGGYLLAVAMLKARGLEAKHLFRSETYYGTYGKALGAVRDGAADVAAVYCPPEATGRGWEAGVDEALPGHARQFRLVGYTAEAPNGGVVVTGALTPERTEAMERAFGELHGSDVGRGVLRDVFSGMERFERAPPRSYRSLYALAVSSL